MIDNLQTPDGISINDFLKTYYHQIVQSAENIIRGNTGFPADQRKELAYDLTGMLAEHLLNMSRVPVNVGAYSHKWMKQQVVWQRTNFEKIARVTSSDMDYSMVDDETEYPCEVLDDYVYWAKLNPIEYTVYQRIRTGATAQDLSDEYNISKGSVHHVLTSIKRKFADARLQELFETNEYIDIESLPEEIRKAYLRNERNTNDSGGSLPNSPLDSKRADE